VGFGKSFPENLVFQRLALKLAHAIFQLLHLGIADHWLVRTKDTAPSLLVSVRRADFADRANRAMFWH
jgi:hypothetical protein